MPDSPLPPEHLLHWPYRSDLPQRFTVNFLRYRDEGGLAEPAEDVRPFVEGGDVGDISRFLFFCMAFDQIRKEGVAGDIAELGVYRGHTAAVLARFARRLGRTAYLLDTFEGFDAKDIRGVDRDQAPAFGDTSLAAVRELVGEENVRYVAGYFPATAADLPDVTYSLVHLDCDLFEPITAGLAYFYPRMAPGGFLIVHDYSSLAWPGAERAVDLFFADKPECPIPLTDGAGSVVIRKARSGGAGSNWLGRQRAALLYGDWVEAGPLALAGALAEGWSVTEDWGVWGLGTSHVLLLFQQGQPGDITLDLDVQMACLGKRETRTVDVWLGGAKLARWPFSAVENRGVREVAVPASAFTPQPDGICVACLEFRPERAVIPAEAVPGTPDTRTLGMALTRARARRIGTAK